LKNLVCLESISISLIGGWYLKFVKNYNFIFPKSNRVQREKIKQLFLFINVKQYYTTTFVINKRGNKELWVGPSIVFELGRLWPLGQGRPS
jgi:hypothetical protein